MKTKSVSYSGRDYTYVVKQNEIAISAVELLDLPKGLILLVYFLAAMKTWWLERATFLGVYDIVKPWVSPKQGGLTETGTQEWGGDAEVVAMAQKHREYLQGKNTRKQPISEDIPKSEPAPLVEGARAEEHLTPTFPATVEELNAWEAAAGAGKPESKPMVEAHSQGEQPSKDGVDKPNHETASPRIIHYLPLDILSPHPSNSKIYDPELNPALLASIEAHGVKVPIIVTPYLPMLEGQATLYRILSGYQRWATSKELNIPTIPAIITNVPEEQQLEILLTCNQCRPKTTIEDLREYRAFRKIEEVKAKKRSGLRTDLGVKLPLGQDFVKSRDSAAAKVHMSGSTADRGLQVLEELERREMAGKNKETELVREALLENVYKGATLALHFGWPILGNKTPKRSKQQKDKVESSKANADSIDEQAEVGARPEREVKAIVGWIDDQQIERAVAKVELAPDDAQVIRGALAQLRQSIYCALGTSPSKEAGARLRKLAEALNQMADECCDANNEETKD